jgi:iron(III) transport system permease protein
LLPIVALAAIASRGSGALWPHLIDYVLPQAAAETAALLAGTGVLVIAVGTGTAWLVTAFRFPGRAMLSWALLLPLATPVYIVAYAYLDLLHPVGPLQEGLRVLLGASGPQDLRLPEFRSLGGAILLFGFVLYPYVYLNVRANFMMQSAEVLEAAQIDGSSNSQVFFQIAVPLARPAIAAGSGLALMETLGDIGACELLGVQSLTVSVYVTWATRGSVEGAAQIALAMLVPVAGVLLLTYRSRVGRNYASGTSHPLAARQLGPVAGIFAAAACAIPVVLGFAGPAIHLLLLAWARVSERGVSPLLLSYAWNSARFAAAATVLAVVAGFALAFCQRYARANAPVRIVQTGYAVPGTVVAVGLLGVLSAADAVIGFIDMENLRGALLLASPLGLLLAYLARFLAIPTSTVEAGYAQLPRELDEAAQLIGAGALSLARHIHWPLLRATIGAAALLIFIECVKELPATLLLRPLNTETLATFLYGEASRGVYEDGAVAALAMIALGLLPILLLSPSGKPGS